MKSMSADEMGMMMDQMANMGPEQEKRMREMGVDPGMMKQSLKVRVLQLHLLRRPVVFVERDAKCLRRRLASSCTGALSAIV